MYSPTDVLSNGTWKSLRDLDDPVLKDLASKLPDTIMVGRASATTRKYMYIGVFRQWKVWALQYDMEAIPVKDF